jgi:3-oxo-5-alpha-steroid 4-dehydrogenase 1
MNSPQLYQAVIWAMLSVAPLVFFLLLFISAPYGRFSRAGWGPVVNNRLGWLVMEAPASLLVAFIMIARMDLSAVTLVFLLIWQLHYFHRAFIYPFSLQGSKSMPVTIVLMAVLFNSINACLISYHFVYYGDLYQADWFASSEFIGGLIIYGTGYAITRRSDAILRSLRGPGEDGYKTPHGFLYRYVSCPNYLGEIIQWAGWAILTWSAAGLVFLIWTIANLMPRAIAHHRWYRETFADYPKERRALIPFVI